MKTIADLFLLNEIILSKLLFSTCISTIFLLRCQFHLQLTNPKTFLKHNTILQTNYYSLLHKGLATDHRCTSALHANWSMGLFDLLRWKLSSKMVKISMSTFFLVLVKESMKFEALPIRSHCAQQLSFISLSLMAVNTPASQSWPYNYYCICTQLYLSIICKH